MGYFCGKSTTSLESWGGHICITWQSISKPWSCWHTSTVVAQTWESSEQRGGFKATAKPQPFVVMTVSCFPFWWVFHSESGQRSSWVSSALIKVMLTVSVWGGATVCLLHLLRPVFYLLAKGLSSLIWGPLLALRLFIRLLRWFIGWTVTDWSGLLGWKLSHRIIITVSSPDDFSIQQ